MNQRERDVLSLLRTENRRVSVGHIAQKLHKQRPTILAALEQLDVLGYVDVIRAGRGEIRLVSIREIGKQAYVDAVQRGNANNVQAQLAELRMAIEELQQIVETQDGVETRKSLSPERLNTILDILTKAPQIVGMIKHLL